MASRRNEQRSASQDAICGGGNGTGVDDRSPTRLRSIREKNRAPAARQTGSTTFQQLTRRLNDLAFSAVALPRARVPAPHTAGITQIGLPIFSVTSKRIGV